MCPGRAASSCLGEGHSISCFYCCCCSMLFVALDSKACTRYRLSTSLQSLIKATCRKFRAGMSTTVRAAIPHMVHLFCLVPCVCVLVMCGSGAPMCVGYDNRDSFREVKVRRFSFLSSVLQVSSGSGKEHRWLPHECH